MLDIRVARGVRPDVIPNLRDRLIEFELEDHAHLVDKATMSLDNGDGRLFTPSSIAFGIAFSISFGYVGALSPPRIYQVRKMSGAMRLGGVGAQTGPNTAAGGIVSLDMRSKLWDMNIFRGASGRGRQDRQLRFENVTVPDVVRALARRNGYVGTSQLIQNDMTNEPIHEDIVIPANASDAEWIREMARERGWVFDVDQDGLRFHSPDFRDAYDTEELAWFAGDPDIIKWDIDGDMNVPQAVDISGASLREETRTGRFSQTGGAERAEAQSDSENGAPGAASDSLRSIASFTSSRTQRTVSSENIFNVPDPTTQRAARAERAINDATKRWKMSFELVGNPRVRARRKVILRNFGPLIDGEWYVKSAKHTYKANSVYRTFVEARRRGPAPGGREIRRWGRFTDTNQYSSGVTLISYPNQRQPVPLRRSMRN